MARMPPPRKTAELTDVVNVYDSLNRADALIRCADALLDEAERILNQADERLHHACTTAAGARLVHSQ